MTGHLGALLPTSTMSSSAALAVQNGRAKGPQAAGIAGGTGDLRECGPGRQAGRPVWQGGGHRGQAAGRGRGSPVCEGERPALQALLPYVIAPGLCEASPQSSQEQCGLMAACPAPALSGARSL